MFKRSPLFYYRMLPLTSSIASLFFDQQFNESDTYEQHEQRLNNVIMAWGMHRCKMAGDGNCCFYSVAFSLITNAIQIKEHNSDLFETINIDPEGSLNDVAKHLRQLAVKEWQSNSQDYEA